MLTTAGWISSWASSRARTGVSGTATSPSGPRRWVPRRKAQVVCAVRGGVISRQEACDRYGISDEELFSWESLLGDHGLRALHVTKTQRYRQAANSVDQDAPSSTAG
jgi:transposase-like protein